MSFGNQLYAKLRGDRVIWMIVAVLAIYSILAVYSASTTLAYRVRGGDVESLMFKHTGLVLFGLFLTYVAYLTPYVQYKRMAPYLLIICIPLLVYTLGFGREFNDARRWIRIPFMGFTFQTSDFAKLALIIYVARAISAKQEYIEDFQDAFMPIIIPILIICGLIAPADLSTAATLFFTCLLMMFMGRVSLKYIALLMFLGIVLFSFLVTLGNFFPEVVRVGTWVSRLKAFIYGTGSDNIQVDQAKIAIASGEWFGVGPGNSIQRNYLPAPFSDYIYAIIIEEYGLIFGGLGVLLLYVTLFFRCVKIVTRSPKAFGAMLALGLGLMLSLQALMNMGVNVNLLPVTGLALPLVSMGGTSVLFAGIAFGMILSVSRYIEKTT
ncbi:MAG TPA: cell division protein FtsW [Saprospiraceae bacterium]|nr:cell division protein FtsW [Saprospiraceae bacterium]